MNEIGTSFVASNRRFVNNKEEKDTIVSRRGYSDGEVLNMLGNLEEVHPFEV